VRAAVASELGDTRDVVAAARRAHRELDAEVARALARDPSNPPACAAGCSYCCHVHVEATRAEVLAVARHLTESRAEAERAAFVERLAAQVRVVEAMDYEQRWNARVRCALLGDDGKCTIYDVRPLRCRAFHSYSADVCREAFAGHSEPDPDVNAALDRACDAAELGFDRALEEGGASAEPVLLEASLLEALSSDTRASTPRT
jgi:Fe-S-cluster containining protein